MEMIRTIQRNQLGFTRTHLCVWIWFMSNCTHKCYGFIFIENTLYSLDRMIFLSVVNKIDIYLFTEIMPFEIFLYFGMIGYITPFLHGNIQTIK